MKPASLPALLVTLISTVPASAAGQSVAPTTADSYALELVQRTLYGPGPLPDQKLAVGHVNHMHPAGFLDLTVPAENNGAEPPNVSGESLQGTPVDGKLSDDTLINENIDMGNALLLNGQFNLLLAAVYGGPHHGDSHFFLDMNLNWSIQDDIAIDPGFAAGVIKINDFQFTTGPKAVPFSLQTIQHAPGGVDQVGSLVSGETVVGRLGDDDADGYLDGVFLAMGNFPYGAVLLPGAPFVQALEFKSNIPVSAADAALLTVAAARNDAAAFLHLDALAPNADRSRERLVTALRERLDLARRHLERASSQCRHECGHLKSAAALVRSASASPGNSEIATVLQPLELATSNLWQVHQHVPSQGR